PAEALAFFRVGRLSEIYDRLADKDPADWQQEFSASSLQREFVENRLAKHAPQSMMLAAAAAPLAETSGESSSSQSLVIAPLPSVKRPQHPPLLHQFGVLTTRYLELLWGDRRGLRLLLLQAPVVAVFILLGFINKPYEQTLLAPRKLTER